MSETIIVNPLVKINNETRGIVPNSCKAIMGQGETKVSAVSVGKKTKIVYGIDATTQIGKITMELYNTAENVVLAKGWKNNPGKNLVDISGDDNFLQIMQNASITNDPEYDFSADGKFSLEWQGSPLE